MKKRGLERPGKLSELHRKLETDTLVYGRLAVLHRAARSPYGAEEAQRRAWDGMGLVVTEGFTEEVALESWHMNGYVKVDWKRGAWVAQSVGRLTSAQVMISRFVSSSPTSGSGLTAQSLKLLRILCFPLSLCPSPTHVLSVRLSVSLKNKH